MRGVMMPVVEKSYFDKFTSLELDENTFTRYEMIAEDTLYAVCNLKPTEAHLSTEEYKRAVCYQIEMIHAQGGINAITGSADIDTASVSESLGEYSISKTKRSGSKSIQTVAGIPVSSVSIGLLRRLGLMCRWAYAEVCNGKR